MKNSFYIISIIILLGCDREVSISSPKPNPSKGELVINSDPAGATIFLNGKNTGKITPDKLLWLEPDKYKITIRKKYFYLINDFVDISKDQSISKFYNYFDSDKVYGTMNITTYPADSVKIIIDGKNTGIYAPHKFKKVIPGKYLIKGIKENHWSESFYHEVYSNKTSSSQLQVIDTTIWVQYNHMTSNIKSERVYQVVVDQQDRKWLNFLDKGLSVFNGSKFTDISFDVRGLNRSSINRLFLDINNNLWIATGNGLFMKDDTHWINYNTTNCNLPSNNIQDVKVRNGKIVAATDKGVAIFSDNNWEIYNKSNSPLPTNLTISADLDKNNNLIIGTSGFGVYLFDGSNWEQYTEHSNNLLTDYIRYVQVINDKLYIICANEPPIFKQPVTNFGGLNVQSGKMFNEITIPIISKSIYEVKEIDNEIWISTGNGAYQLDQYNNVMKIYHTDYIPDQITNSIITLDKDSEGNLWFGCFDKGLIKYKINNNINSIN